METTCGNKVQSSYTSLYSSEDMQSENESHSDSSRPWNSPGQNTGVSSLSLLQGNLPSIVIKLRTPALQADSLPAEPQGKPKNTGVGSQSLLQGIFPIQELNWGLLHCMRILHQLSYEGSLDMLNISEALVSLSTNKAWTAHRWFGGNPLLGIITGTNPETCLLHSWIKSRIFKAVFSFFLLEKLVQWIKNEGH